MPGWKKFASKKGSKWFRKVESIVAGELVPPAASRLKQWRQYLDGIGARRTGDRPAVP